MNAFFTRALVPFPLPSGITYGEESVSVSYKFEFVCAPSSSFSSSSCDQDLCRSSTIVQDAFKRYGDILRPKRATPSSTPLIESMQVCIRTNDTALGPHTDETYELEVTKGTASVASANSVYGLLHALESFSQVVDELGGGFVVENTPLRIEDEPRFSYRGLLIDTGRHFLPVDTIKRAIDGLHMNRMNVLHWHIVDSQSFPCGSDTFPQLAEKGAFSEKAIYSTSEMRDIVAYGKSRGVRVMPEWDIPGHGSWGAGMPEIMGCDIVLDPTNATTYDFLNAFFEEMMTIFEDEYVFLGGDEVDYTCWDANPKIAEWLKANGMNSSQLQQYFWAQVRERVLPASLAGRTISIWENDVLQIDPMDLPNGTVANVYQSKATADRTIGTYRMPSVLSIAGDNWYLDSQCSGYNWNSWKCRYTVEPTSNLTKQKHLLPLLLGGEGAMWGEGINKDNFDAYVWHGTAAIAERLWSPADLTQSADDASPRLSEQMCRMSARGFRPGPIGPGYCPGDL